MNGAERRLTVGWIKGETVLIKILCCKTNSHKKKRKDTRFTLPPMYTPCRAHTRHHPSRTQQVQLFKKEISCIIYHHLLLLFLPFQGMFFLILRAPPKVQYYFNMFKKHFEQIGHIHLLIICYCCYPVSILRLIGNHRCNVPNQKFLLLSLS